MRAGFSLVEVIMALGIASFALIALLGLMAVGLQADKSSREDTIVAGLAMRVLADLTSAGYNTLADEDSLFNFEGEEANATDAFFKCIVVVREPASDRPEMAQSKSILMTFSWPCRSLSDAGSEHRTFTTAVVKN